MIDNLLSGIKALLGLIPFIILVWISKKNLKKEIRSRQFLMPLLALLFSIAVGIFMTKITDLIHKLISVLPDKISLFGEWAAGFLPGVLNGSLSNTGLAIQSFAETVAELIKQSNVNYLLMVFANTAIILIYLVFKGVLMPILKGVFKTGNVLHDKVSSLCYEYDSDNDAWFLKRGLTDARTFSRISFIAAFIISILAVSAYALLYKSGRPVSPIYPVFSIIVIGEVFYYLNALSKDEAESIVAGEKDRSLSVRNYAIVRRRLKDLFGDKLVAEDTAISNAATGSTEANTWLNELESGLDGSQVAYAAFFKSWLASGEKVDIHYLKSGRDLLKKKSILFNNPFYYDLIPYVPYAMDRTLLNHKKVLVVAGRHGTTEDIKKWVEAGLLSVSHIPELWRIGELTTKESSFDVGILSKSNLHDPEVLAQNAEFLNETEFVMIIEPSRLLPTAQVGLNSLVRIFSDRVHKVAFCSVDKNCDGLVDALSHVLMTNIVEVSATEKHDGSCSYMCWAPDEDYLQHRIVPNISRYLGVGTELSFAALKQQIPATKWYGGDRFPVVDMRWIVGQYYYDLLNYADLAAEQSLLDQYFTVSYNMWDEGKHEASYITVEDESFNLMEIKREFATRSTEESFINVISSEYLLRDYMAANSQLFDADPKAIPYIVADYAHTVRNVVLRLCLRMSSGFLYEDEIKRELKLVGIEHDDLTEALWAALCECANPIRKAEADDDGSPTITRKYHGRDICFNSEVIQCKRQYLIDTGTIENTYYIDNKYFTETILGDLKNVSIIAEVEDSSDSAYLGSELAGDIFQKYLPGQFLTLNGKYYEMLNVTSDGEMVVRRASEHLNERVFYRQIRRYNIHAVTSSEEMGSLKDYGDIRVLRQRADFEVETPAYWQMHKYNDFKTARRIEINGIPNRTYFNKSIIRIDFPELREKQSKDVLATIALLINEVMVTLFAENNSYIAVATPGSFEAPITYEIRGDEGSDVEQFAIYVIEDSQMDIGLLSAFERNIDRILKIVCDYLEWHNEAISISINPPSEEIVSHPYSQTSEPAKKEKKNIFRKIAAKIKSFFGKIFGGKKKEKAGDTDKEIAEKGDINTDISNSDSSEEKPAMTDAQPELVPNDAEKEDLDAIDKDQPNAGTLAEGTVVKDDEKSVAEDGGKTHTGIWGKLKGLFGRKKEQKEKAAQDDEVDLTGQSSPADEDSAVTTDAATGEDISKDEVVLGDE